MRIGHGKGRSEGVDGSESRGGARRHSGLKTPRAPVARPVARAAGPGHVAGRIVRPTILACLAQDAATQPCASFATLDRLPRDIRQPNPVLRHAVNVSLDEPLQLLHTAHFGTLATRSRVDGCPYPTVLPFAPDARHRPVFLVSRLAEHTRNLQADAHAGFLLFDGCTPDVLGAPRTTLTGRAVPSECAGGGAASPVRRYLRYHPDAERYLALGDFSFFTFVPARLRHISGFGAMGWVDAHELNTVAPLDEVEEAALIEAQSGAFPASIRLLGIDRFGIDFARDGQRLRERFENPAIDSAALTEAISIATSRITGKTPATR